MFVGFKKIIANKGYKGELTVICEEDESTLLRCYENCNKCLQTSAYNNENNKSLHTTKTIKGKFFMVSGANISCACTKCPNGIAPYSHLGDGNLYLVLVHHTSLINNIRLLLRMSSKNGTIDDLPFIEICRAKEFYFHPIEHESKWNCDGEVQMQSDIHAR